MKYGCSLLFFNAFGKNLRIVKDQTISIAQ